MKVIESGLAAALDPRAVDMVVVGAGGAGMATALFGALRGARVLLVESTGHVGGTTAWSAGTTWIPGSRHCARVHPGDSLDEARRYLDNAVGNHSDPALRQTFLDQGPATVAELEGRTSLQFRPYPKHPDYISDLGGSTLCGRALEPLPFDGRLLGDLFQWVRPPIPEFTVLGGMMVDRTDIHHLLGMTGSWASLRHSLRILGRHARDRLAYSRGTRLVMGNALVARLLHSLAAQSSVTLALHATLIGLQKGVAGDVTGVQLSQAGETVQVGVRGGVVLASGGFNRHPERRAAQLPGADPGWCPGAPGHIGQAHDVAQAAGGVYGHGHLSPAFWAPVSRRQRPDGSWAVFPHFVMDRAKPGMLTVNARGQRFVNESTSYHLFGLAMRSTPEAVPAFLVCDARALRQYGVGMVRPGGKGLAPYLADGYLVQAPTLPGLATALGVPPEALAATVERFNQQAEAGEDPEFARGRTAYQQNIGDPTWRGPNPNLGALTEAPFYAVRLYPGDIGAACGFAGDAHAQVLGSDHRPLGGLYAVGNDLQSIMGGVYPAPGITLGPALVFARQAASHACARAGLPAQGA